MTEDEQIQEIAITMQDCCVFKYYTECKQCPLHKTEKLYNAGYRKTAPSKIKMLVKIVAKVSQPCRVEI